MVTNTSIELSEALHEKARKAIGHALGALSGAEPLVPFAMTWRGSDATIERFMYGAYDDSVEQALRAVNEAPSEVDSYAVVWGGYVDGPEGERQEAIIAEVAERRSPRSVQLAQPFTQSASDSEGQREGGLMSVGVGDNLLLTKLSAFTLSNHLLKPAYVSSAAFATNVTSQPFAQLPVALVCLAANLVEGHEQERVTLGIRKLQELEGGTSVALTQRALSAVIAAVGEGDLMQVLPSADVQELLKVVVLGAGQLQTAVQKGLVVGDHAEAYLADMHVLLDTVLTSGGSESPPPGSEKLVTLLKKASTTPADAPT